MNYGMKLSTYIALVMNMIKLYKILLVIQYALIINLYYKFVDL